MTRVHLRNCPGADLSGEDSIRLAYRPDWSTAVGVALGVFAVIFLAGWGEKWLHLTVGVLALAFPVVVAGLAFGCHRFLIVRASCFDFASGEFRMRTTWALLLRGPKTQLPLKNLPPVETGVVNQNDMAPSWGIFVRLPGTAVRTALCAGHLYAEAAGLAAMLNLRRAQAIGRMQITLDAGGDTGSRR